MPAAAVSDITATVRESPSWAARIPQPVAYLRDAGGPAGEDEAVGDEGGVDGPGGAADLRPGPSGRLRVSDVTCHYSLVMDGTWRRPGLRPAGLFRAGHRW